MGFPEFQRPDPTEEQIIRAASAYGHYNISNIAPLGGTPNASYLVSGLNESIVLRFCNTEYTSPVHLVAETCALKALQRREQVVTPVLIYSLQDRNIEKIDGFPVIATQYIAGTRLDVTPRHLISLRNIGRSIGILTCGLRRLSLPLSSSDTFIVRSERLLQLLPRHDGQQDWPREVSATTIHAWKIYKTYARPSQVAPAHTDIWPQNLILRGNKWWIVDFDDMALANSEIDIGSALSELAVFGDRTLDYPSAIDLLRGYGQTDIDGLLSLRNTELLPAILGLYVSWIACDATHGLPFESVQHYYERLVAFAQKDAYNQASAALRAAVYEACSDFT